jgi:hypothetical protein
VSPAGNTNLTVYAAVTSQPTLQQEVGEGVGREVVVKAAPVAQSQESFQVVVGKKRKNKGDDGGKKKKHTTKKMMPWGASLRLALHPSPPYPIT